MIAEHVFVGGMIVLLCALLFGNERLILDRSRYGQRLIRWFGPVGGRWAFRGLTLAGAIFGILLATGVIRPIRW